MNDVAQKIQEIVGASVSVPIPKAQKRRILRLSQQAKQVWNSSRIIDSATKDSLITGLKKLGWEVCCCRGEADVCIGRKADKHPGQVVAASTDSDMLFHRLKTLLRKDAKSHVFTEYEIENVIQKLEINEVQWIVAGIVTNNDYSGHVKGQSFAKNLAVVRRGDAMDEESVLEQYCAEMGVSSMRYRPAMDIFIDRFETTEEESNSNEAVDMTMKKLVESVSMFFQR
ncbi:hypothetical protein BGX20_007219, partial [Mortierella sp. AD010]